MNNPDKFFDDDYLPLGVNLVEISKMKSEALQSCYSFWHARQKAGDDAFMFKHVDPSDFRIPSKKRKSTHDHEEEGSGQHVTPSDLPPSPSPDPHSVYALIISVFFMCLRIIRTINSTQQTSPKPSQLPSPHVDNVTRVLEKSKGKPIEMYCQIYSFWQSLINCFQPLHG
jgi:hypothetical protein